jgi:hypothetical protein
MSWDTTYVEVAALFLRSRKPKEQSRNEQARGIENLGHKMSMQIPKG